VIKRSPDGRIYCSLECYRTGERPQRKTGKTGACLVCATTFYAPAGRPDARFCTLACANIFQGRNKVTLECKAYKLSPSTAAIGNRKYCSTPCRDADPAVTAQLLTMNIRQMQMCPNNFERACYAILDGMGLAYEKQHLIGSKFCVDAFVPTAGLIIQFDGDYWHGNPIRFPEPNVRQRRRMMLDKSQDAYMAACGHRVLRLWESDIKRAPREVPRRVREAMGHVAPVNKPSQAA